MIGGIGTSVIVKNLVAKPVFKLKIDNEDNNFIMTNDRKNCNCCNIF